MSDRDIVNLPLTSEERALLEEAARQSRLSLIQWIKIIALKTARDVVQGGQKHP